MCTWYYADYRSLSPIIDKAQQLPLAFSMMNAMSKPKTMSGNIRPTDMAAVFAPNKQGVVRIFDSYSQELVFTDGVRIAVADMSALTFIDEV